MKNSNIAIVGIGALATYYLISKSSNSNEQLYSFGAGQGGVGAGSTFTLLENSGNTVNNVNAPVYDTKKETTVINYSPTNNNAGSPATTSSGSGGSSGIINIPLNSPTGQMLQSVATQDAQLKKSQAVYGLDNSNLGSYKFPAPTKSTYVPAPTYTTVPTNSTTKKESSTGSSGGGLLSSIGKAIGSLFRKK